MLYACLILEVHKFGHVICTNLYFNAFYWFSLIMDKNSYSKILKVYTVNDLIAAPGALHFQKGGR